MVVFVSLSIYQVSCRKEQAGKGKETSSLSCWALTSCNLTDLITLNNVNKSLCATSSNAFIPVRFSKLKRTSGRLTADYSGGLQRQQKAMRWVKLQGFVRFHPFTTTTTPSLRCVRHNGGRKVLQKIRSARLSLSRMESVCAGDGFYQRQTLTGIPVWDCPSNSCVPQEALHKKQVKTPGDISYVASRLEGSSSN